MGEHRTVVPPGGRFVGRESLPTVRNRVGRLSCPAVG